MTATVMIEHQTAEVNSELGRWAVFQGRNLIRFVIAAWPKITQQFVGLTVFNTYAVYFCKSLWPCTLKKNGSNSASQSKLRATRTLS